MPVLVEVTTSIDAAPEVVFDLELDIGVHTASLALSWRDDIDSARLARQSITDSPWLTPHQRPSRSRPRPPRPPPQR